MSRTRTRRRLKLALEVMTEKDVTHSARVMRLRNIAEDSQYPLAWSYDHNRGT